MINTFENIIIKEDKGYFFSFERNGLFEIDLKKWNLKLLTYCEKHGYTEERLFANAVMYGQWLILIPMQASEFMAYNLQTSEKKYISIPNVTGKYKKTAKFLSAHIQDHTLFAIGHSYPGIVKIDLNNWTAGLMMDVSSNRYQCMIEEQDAFRYSKRIGNIIYIASAWDNSIVILNPFTEELEYRKIDCKTDGFATLFQFGKNYILVSLYDNKLTEWNPENNKINEIIVNSDNAHSSISNFKYSNSLSWNQYEVIIPLCNEKIIVFNRITREVAFIEVEAIVNGFDETIAPVRCIFQYNQHLYAVSGNSGEVFAVDIKDQTLRNTGHKIVSDFGNGNYLGDKNVVFAENKVYGLKDFISDTLGLKSS